MEINVLPAAGVISVASLAKFCETNPNTLMQRLSDKGIPVLKLSISYKQRLVRLEDLRIME